MSEKHILPSESRTAVSSGPDLEARPHGRARQRLHAGRFPGLPARHHRVRAREGRASDAPWESHRGHAPGGAACQPTERLIDRRAARHGQGRWPRERRRSKPASPSPGQVPVHPGSGQEHLFDRWSVPPRRARQANRRPAARFAQALDRARQPGWHRCSGSAHLGPVRATDVVQVAIRQLSARDKKMLAASAVQAPAWMWRTLVSIANTISGALDG